MIDISVASVMNAVNKKDITAVADIKDSIANVVDKLRSNDIGVILVLDDDSIAGIVSERDIVRADLRNIDIRVTPVSKIMTKNIIFTSPKESLEDCIEKMLSKNIRHLPVIDSTNVLVGIISIKDLLAGLFGYVREQD
jgi:CBS domain-containing protein